MKGASTSVVDRKLVDCFYAIEIASPRNDAMFGASTSVVDKDINTVLYATKVASPERL